MNPVQVEDVEARWRPLSAQETTNAQSLLADAWALLTNRRRTLDDDITAGSVSIAEVVRVECAMVLRVMRNPDGFVTEHIDDWTGTRSAETSGGKLFVTPEELADLTPTSQRGRRRGVRLVAYGDV